MCVSRLVVVHFLPLFSLFMPIWFPFTSVPITYHAPLFIVITTTRYFILVNLHNKHPYYSIPKQFFSNLAVPLFVCAFPILVGYDLNNKRVQGLLLFTSFFTITLLHFPPLLGMGKLWRRFMQKKCIFAIYWWLSLSFSWSSQIWSLLGWFYLSVLYMVVFYWWTYKVMF